MKLIVMLVTAMVMVHSGLCIASESTHNAAAENMLKSMKLETTLSHLTEEILRSQLATDPCLAPYEKVLRAFYQKYFSWAYFKDDFIKMYTAAFTENELNEIAKFYNTPVGQKTLEKLPQLTMAGMQIGTKILKAHEKELVDQIKAENEKIDPKTLSPECRARFENRQQP